MDTRRVMDLTLGPIALALVAPVLIAVWLAMRLTGDHDPFFYRAERVGEHGRPFAAYKIRTMTVAHDGPRITLAGDQRVTRVGRVLRRFRIDELPQLINVLRGEMSLVGPRPEDPRYVDLSDPLHRRVFTARPGITGLAQLEFHGEARMLTGPDAERVYREQILPAKLRLDAEYLDHRSVALDLKIMVRTVRTALG